MIRTVNVDARRYAWSMSRAVWLLGMPITGLLEDLQGAAESGQSALASDVARNLGEACLVALDLAVNFTRPIPEPGFRVSAVLRRMSGDDIAKKCSELVFQPATVSATTLYTAGLEAVEAVRDVVGDVPNVLTSEGYFPALSTAAGWLQLLNSLGEPGFLPELWSKADAGSEA